MQSRRGFLRLLGASLGGTVLSSCGSSKQVLKGATTAVGGGGGGNPTPTGASGTKLPSGYNFSPVITTHAGGGGRGRDMNDQGMDYFVPGSPSMNDQGQIFLYGGGTDGNTGVLQLTMDYGRGRAPQVVDSRILVKKGQMLDGVIVNSIMPGDTNRNGGFAVEIQGEGKPTRVYVRQGPTDPLEPILDLLSQVGDVNIGGSIQNVDLADNGDILLVASYLREDSPYSNQGIVHLPGGSTQNGSVVAGSEEAPPGVGGQFDTFGLVEMNESGNYVFQATITRMERGRAIQQVQTKPTGIAAVGRLGRPVSESYLLAASGGLGASRAEVSGDPFYAPRVSPDSSVTKVVRYEDGRTLLYYRDILIAQTGGMSPKGNVIRDALPGVVNAVAGLCYYQLSCEGGEELCVTNGADFSTLLSTGEMMEGKRVAGFIFGFNRECTDSEGRMVVQAWFTDGSTAVVVGFPA